MADKTFTMRDRNSATDYDVRLTDNGDGTYSQAVELVPTPGVDIGDVTINNAAGAAAVNVQDGGNALTVDGSVSLAAEIPAGTKSIGGVQLVDEAGALYGVKHIGNKPRVSSMPYLFDIAEGNVAGHMPWSMMAYNGDIGTAEEDVWVTGGLYAWPAAGGIRMQVKSDSGDDDGDPVGTGVRTVTIYYLDETHAERTETVILNGTTGVNTTATNIFRVNSFRATTIGSGGKAAGNIVLTDTTPTVTYASIAAGYTRSRNGFYTVPLGKTLYVTSVVFSVYGATKGIRYTLRSTWDDDASVIRDFFIPHAEIMMGNGAVVRALDMPEVLPATSRIRVSGKADQAGAVCSVVMRGWMEE